MSMKESVLCKGFDFYNMNITDEVAKTLQSEGGGSGVNEGCVPTYRKTSHAKSAEDGQGWQETQINDTLNIFDNGESRTPTLVLENRPQDSRIKIKEDGIIQTLDARMGEGGATCLCLWKIRITR